MKKIFFTTQSRGIEFLLASVVALGSASLSHAAGVNTGADVGAGVNVNTQTRTDSAMQRESAPAGSVQDDMNALTPSVSGTQEQVIEQAQPPSSALDADSKTKARIKEKKARKANAATLGQ